MSKTGKILLILTLLLAAFLRLYRLSQHDVINDESYYGYRSVGLVDSLDSPDQPTPLELLGSVPFWGQLSFHDHPPLGFWIGHAFFKVFGANLWGLRLPAALAGIASVYLVFLIGRRLFKNETVGLVAAGILAINTAHVWVSRTGLQESLVIFFMLLAVWLFLKTLTPSSSPPIPTDVGTGGERKISPPPKGKGEMKEGVYFYLTATVVGLALLMKYTAIVLIPIFFTYLLWKRRDLLSWRRLFTNAVLLLLIVSPVIIYNLWLYHRLHHFDFQISYLLKQNVPEWQTRPGREVGTITERARHIFTHYQNDHGIPFIYGVPFTVLSALALAYGLWNRKNPATQFLLAALGWLFLLLLVIGPWERYLPMLTPFLVLLVVAIFHKSLSLPLKIRRGWGALLLLFLIAEILVSLNTNLPVNPKGRKGLHYTYIREEANTWGFNQWEDYFANLTKQTYPEVSFPSKFAFVKTLQTQNTALAQTKHKTPTRILFVVDARIDGPALLWYFTRHATYEGWPIISDVQYLEALARNRQIFTGYGFSKTIFVKAADNLLKGKSQNQTANALEKALLEQNLKPDLIIGPRHNLAFAIYKF